jgi:hypothetical protein
MAPHHEIIQELFKFFTSKVGEVIGKNDSYRWLAI